MTIENYKDFQAELTKVVQPFILASIDNDRQKFRTVGLFPIKLEAEVTVTVHRVVRCTNFVADSDSHLDRLKRNNSNEGRSRHRKQT